MAQDFRMPPVVPGQADTVKRGTFPYDRPAQFADPREAMTFFLGKMQEERTQDSIINALDTGVPLDVLTSFVVRTLTGEGIISPQSAAMVGPAIMGTMAFMAEEAGVKPTLTLEEPNQLTAEDIRRFTSEAEEVVEEITDITPEDGGLMSPIRKEDEVDG